MNKRLIFTITTGRSGSLYLAELLRNSGITAFHEPDPSFVSVMRPIQKDYKLALDFWKYYKLPQIEKSIRLKHNKVYFESSHLFCKGFIEPLIDLKYIPDIVILKRDNRLVALSLLKLQTIPDTPAGLKWCLSLKDPHVCKLPPRNWTPYQLCYWYTLEIDRRAKFYEKYLPTLGSSILKIQSQDLFDGNCFDEMSIFFNTEISLKPNFKLMKNERESIKIVQYDDQSLQAQEQEVNDSIIF